MESVISPVLRHGLRQKEAAAELGVSPRTLQRWMQEGFGPQPHRDGAQLLYDPAEIVAFKAGARA